MDPILDPRCLMTTESLVVDGANGVCHEPRLDARQPPGATALFALAMTIGAISWFVRAQISLRLRRALLLGTLALAALPGAWAILAVRADAPRSVDRSARRLTRTHDEVRAFAHAHQCAWIRTESSVAAEPITRLAMAGQRCADPAPIDLFADALESGCVETEEGSLACGTIDDDSRLPEQALPPPMPLVPTPAGPDRDEGP
jgi:hypothetical protein